MVSLTPKIKLRVESNTWTWIEWDRKGGRDGKCGKSVQKSPEAVEAASHVEGQPMPSPHLLGGKSRKPCEEESVWVLHSSSSTTTLEEPFSNLPDTRVAQWSCLVSKTRNRAPVVSVCEWGMLCKESQMSWQNFSCICQLTIAPYFGLQQPDQALSAHRRHKCLILRGVTQQIAG